MIPRALRAIHTEIKGLHAAAFVLAVASFFSSILALFRDRLFAHTFGASRELDLYIAAFRIPDLLFVLLGALVSVYFLIPELARRSPHNQKKYFETMCAGFAVFAVFAALFAYFLAGTIIPVLYPKFAANDINTVIVLTRIMLLQPVLLGFSNIFAAVTQSKMRYALYAISPLMYNAGIILSAVFLYPIFGLSGLAWGVVLGSALHFAVQIPSVVRDGMITGIPRVHSFSDLIHSFALSLPRSLALSMSQLASIALTALAATLAPGSIAIFTFAFNLQAVPLGIVGASFSIAAFPTLTLALSRGETAQFVSHIASAARYVFFWSLPLVGVLVVTRAHIVRFILGSGHFDWTDTRLTAAVFALLILSLPAQGLQLLLIRGYYASGRTFMPFLLSFFSTVITIGSCVLLLNASNHSSFSDTLNALMRIQYLPGSEVLDLGLAYAGASIVTAVIMTGHFNRRFPGFLSQVRASWGRSFFAGFMALASSYATLAVIGDIQTYSTTLTIFLEGFAAGTIGLIVAGSSLALTGSTEFYDTLASMRGRLHVRRWSSGVAVAHSAEEV